MPRIADIDRFTFIVGAPRCGTTTMARWLQAHPQMLFPFVKEPHFFWQHDLRGLERCQAQGNDRAGLSRSFLPQAEAERRIGADCSVSYLYGPEQLEPVLKLWPNSRFIVGVRDPLTLIPSLHKRLIFTGDENLRRIEDAWAAVPDRAAGRRIPWSTIDPRWLRYDEAARYGTHVERLFAAVGKERCLVMLFDDLVADPAGQHRRLLEFAGLRQAPLPRAQSRARGQGRALVVPPTIAQAPAAHASPLSRKQALPRPLRQAGKQGNGRTRIGRIRDRFASASFAGTDYRTRSDRCHFSCSRVFATHYQDEVDRLAGLIDRDLAHWLQPRK